MKLDHGKIERWNRASLTPLARSPWSGGVGGFFLFAHGTSTGTSPRLVKQCCIYHSWLTTLILKYSFQQMYVNQNMCFSWAKKTAGPGWWGNVSFCRWLYCGFRMNFTLLAHEFGSQVFGHALAGQGRPEASRVPWAWNGKTSIFQCSQCLWRYFCRWPKFKNMRTWWRLCTHDGYIFNTSHCSILMKGQLQWWPRHWANQLLDMFY